MFSVPALSASPRPLRHLIFVLGDQLDSDSAAFDGFDVAQDAVFMAEVRAESEYVWSTKPRTAMFLSAMRHFAQQQHDAGRRVFYTRLDDAHNTHTLIDELARAVALLRPQRVIAVEPGEWRLREALRAFNAAPVAASVAAPLELRDDRHFLCTHAAFAKHARARKQLRMEFFYREQRRAHKVLMDGDEPAGGAWNFDADNRKSFGARGPRAVPPRKPIPPDAITREVIALVNTQLAEHAGSLDAFDWPVTRAQALQTLHDFIAERLPRFGDHQDAMWTGEPWLFHAHISAALNLKLLNPREVIAAAEQAWREGRAPLAATEGFIRQILGWREYVRGVYWHLMPQYLEHNALDAQQPLPAFYWSGDTPMNCLRETITQTLQLGYAHHIQRLMVTGLYALLLGVRPQDVHGWYLAVYVDAVEWVELPNTLGMSQYGDGGVMASKPYAATGKYIDRMSNYCKGCRFKPDQSTGAAACPFTTLYWDFLARHEKLLAKNQRMALQIKNLARLDDTTRAAIAARAAAIRANDGVPPVEYAE